MSEMKLCKDCKHYQPSWGHPFGGPLMPEMCRAPMLMRESPVTGERIWRDPKANHYPLHNRDIGGCGSDAAWFELSPLPEPVGAGFEHAPDAEPEQSWIMSVWRKFHK